MTSTRYRQAIAAALVAVAVLGSASCGDAVRQGRSPGYLIIDQLTGASGAKPKEYGNVVQSDVLTLVKQQVNGDNVLVPTVFEDPGLVQLHVAMKDPTVGPSEVNSITIERYHVTFVRSDGRAVQGVDVPYAFDGAATGTITPSGGSVGFVLVRAQAKIEAPLKELRDGGTELLLSTIAQVTFYGHDQAGNAVAVNASISVNFADWADPS